ncbi:tyrosine-type recombinase/integrase [Methylocystis parvus]|uniref:tyrosine-type recombinase/integrase n=1 Tax=Methylocystis parvus TaxID=134 RepID=UPI003C718D55
MRQQLTDLSVRALKSETGKQLKVWDLKTPGFGVRVNAQTKSWIVMFGAARQLKVLGRYPDMPLAEARKKALAILSAVNAPTTAAPLAPTFDEALERYLELHGVGLSPRWRKENERIIKRHFGSAFAGKRIDAIGHGDVARVLDKLVKTPGEALHAFTAIRTFFRWCVPRYLPHAPTDRMKPPAKYVPRKRVLSDNELAAVWRAADGYPFGTIVRLLILTGQRWSEIASLRWSFIDPGKKTITLPETKNGRVHSFPLGDMAAQIIGGVPHLAETTFLFPGRDKENFWNGSGKAKWLLDKALPLPPWVLHDIRRTVATNLAALKVPPHVTERLLNHSSGTISGVAAIYNQFTYLEEMREALAAWEAKIAALLSAPEK